MCTARAQTAAQAKVDGIHLFYYLLLKQSTAELQAMSIDDTSDVYHSVLEHD
jgi:hypothetical protein